MKHLTGDRIAKVEVSMAQDVSDVDREKRPRGLIKEYDVARALDRGEAVSGFCHSQWLTHSRTASARLGA